MPQAQPQLEETSKLKKNGLPPGKGLYWDRDVIWYKICKNGQELRGSCGTDKWKDAVKVRDAVSEKLVKKEVVIGAKGVKVDDLLNNYLKYLERENKDRKTYRTSTHYNAALAFRLHISPTFGKLKADKITTELLDKHVDTRTEEGATRITINRELSYMRAAFNLGRKSTPPKVAIIPVFPINIDAEKRAKRTGTISEDQEKLLLQHLPAHMKPLLPTLLYGGVRMKEARFIRWPQIDWATEMIGLRAGETKNGKARVVPMISPQMVEPLRIWKEWTEKYFPEAEFVFHYNGEQVKSYRTAWYKALIKAGLRVKEMNEDGSPVLTKQGKQQWKNLILFHDARRSNRTRLLESGVQAVDSKQTMGHLTDSQHDDYAQSKTSAIRVKAQLEGHMNKTKAEPEPLTASAGIGDVASQLERLKAILTPEQFQLAVVRILGTS